MTDLASMDATGQAQLVRDGELTPAELVEAAIGRIEDLNPQLNAVIHSFYEEAREAAKDPPDGPFRGVPFLLKGLGATLAGQPMHLGNRALKEIDLRAPVDSYAALRYRDAGLITLGKTNVPELGIQPTTEPVAYGPTRNPWNPELSAGGSSGGAAAAVASGMVPAAAASDGGGSIRIPASACGLVGLKTTRQRVSEGPLVGDVYSGLNVEFAITRSARDAAALLDAVQGAAPGDPYVAPDPARPYTAELEAEAGELRVGMMIDPIVPDLSSHPECAAAVRGAAELLESLGHRVSDSAPVGEDAGGAGGGGGTSVADAFLTRWAAGQASTLDRLSAALAREFGPDDVEPLTWALAEIGRERSAGRYLNDVGLHQMVSRVIAAWFESGFDLLLTPTMAEPPVPLGTFDDSGPEPFAAFTRAIPQGAFTVLFNATGQPAISLPLHWTPEGLPVGVQLVAAYGREDLLIQVAAQLERAKPWTDRTPPLFAGRDT